MSDNPRKPVNKSRSSRRQFLAAAAVTALTGGVSRLSAESESNVESLKGVNAEPPNQQIEGEERDCENITDYGAQSNPDDPDLVTAQRNVNAIWKAAKTAGPGGTLYVPAGIYYIGSERDSFNIDFGRNEPGGISWYGDGPAESIVAPTEHMDKDDQSHVLMYYASNSDTHGTVEMQDIQFYGNSGNLDGLKTDTKRSSFGINVEGGIEALQCENVLFDSWHDQAVRTRGVGQAVFRDCTFFECGAESRKKNYSGHTVSLSGDATFRNCQFRRAGSFVINYSSGSGTLRMRDCYVRGYGSGLLKFSSGETAGLRNVFVQGSTPWVRENYPENEDPAQSFKGRTFVDQILDDNGIQKRLWLRDVEFFDCLISGIRCRHDMLLDADRVAIHNANSEGTGDGAISSQGGGDLHCDMAGQEISIHGTKGYALDIRSDATGSGTIGTLHRNGNTDGLGNLDEVTITKQRLGVSPLDPDTPDEFETGICVPLKLVPIKRQSL